MSIDLDKARLPQDYSEKGAVEKIHTVIPVSKPPKTAFFRVHPGEDFVYEAYLISYERNEYLVFPAVAEAFPELARAVRIVAVVTREGVPYVWPLRLPGGDGRTDNWANSALEIADLAKKHWMRMHADMNAGCYSCHKAKGITAEPAWPDLTMGDFIQKAFRDFCITDLEHPIARELLGDNTHAEPSV